jgi:hypothetical protein
LATSSLLGGTFGRLTEKTRRGVFLIPIVPALIAKEICASKDKLGKLNNSDEFLVACPREGAFDASHLKN